MAERGKGQGFEQAGNTTLTIRLEINGQLDQKITAINTGVRGQSMVFLARNKDFEFTTPINEDYTQAFRQMFNRINGARNNGG